MKMKEVLAVVLAGGAGERLYPLTKDRAKPAVPFGGIYRLIDFTLSNAVNSEIRKIFVLSQYKSDSLNRHIQYGWNIFSPEFDEFILVLPPQQRISEEWYTGTASAIYQNIYSIRKSNPKYVMILSADHVYKMDYSKMLEFHKEQRADLTVSAIDVPLEEVHRFGILQVDDRYRITSFVEKPKTLSSAFFNGSQTLASMGIYIFDTDVLIDVLEKDAKRNTEHDFGKNIIPSMFQSHRIFAYPFRDENKKKVQYWRDVGTIDSYWEANMDLVSVDPVFNLYDPDWPIRTYQGQYPPAKMISAGRDGVQPGLVLDSIVSPGCLIRGGRVQNSVLSPGVRVNEHAEVRESVLMDGVVVGRHARVRRAIISKNVEIPPGANIGSNTDEDKRRFLVSEKGVVVIPKGAVLRSADSRELQRQGHRRFEKTANVSA